MGVLLTTPVFDSALDELVLARRVLRRAGRSPFEALISLVRFLTDLPGAGSSVPA
jgi:hypothetical protein